MIDLLAGQDCCLTAQEIFDRLRASGRRVGIASVYRVLELLSSEGLVQRIDLGSGISRYEPIHSGGDHHHHLVCDSCGRVEAFEDPSARAGAFIASRAPRDTSSRATTSCSTAPAATAASAEAP